MTIGLFKGVNKAGHPGWTRVKCAICNRDLDLFRAVDEKNVYYCEECVRKGRNAYFCDAHARNLHFRCPYCRNELKPYYS
ncbi:MAG: hypothetical protein B6U89_02490 [Desulfurococcales archaeon ex4484_58]|nr:MAG: hypothetical protein B6U89_02490 [Desulfurococcales archaeon ex4484_58]